MTGLPRGTRSSFFNATKLINIWNKTITWEGMTLSTVMWHPMAWKIGVNHEVAIDSSRHEGFRTQEDLWEHIKSLLLSKS